MATTVKMAKKLDLHLETFRAADLCLRFRICKKQVQMV